MLNPSHYTSKKFKFQSGAILNEIKLEYTTLGKVKRDSGGNIRNAILFLHGWSGDYSSFKRFNEFTKPGQVFDENKYFIICTTALGISWIIRSFNFNSKSRFSNLHYRRHG